MSARGQIPNCLVCGERMILGTRGKHVCAYAHLHGSNRKRLLVIAWTLGLLALTFAMLFLFAGCTTTVTPKIPAAKVASFDGNEQNSGYLGKNSAGVRVITAHGRDRYNALIQLYGKAFQPPLKMDDGISVNFIPPGTFAIDAQHLVDFMTMERWKKEGK